jgi:hypothetical protein
MNTPTFTFKTSIRYYGNNAIGARGFASHGVYTAMDTLAASPFALLDAHGSLCLVTDAVHEDDALCLALACRAMRDALGARFPACPRAGGRAVAELAARVTADGVLNLSYDPDDESDGNEYDSDDDDNLRGLRALPEGLGRLAYLPGRGLKRLELSDNENLTALPAGLCALAGLEELNVYDCGLTALPEGIGGLTGLKELELGFNQELTALPAGLCALAGLEGLDLNDCGLTALPEGMEGLAGLRRLNLYCNQELAALPAGLWTLAGLEELILAGCGLTALPEGVGRLAGLRALDLSTNKGLTALPAGLWSLAGLEELYLGACGLTALPEQGMEGLTCLKKLGLSHNEGLAALPAGLGLLRNLEQLNLDFCPGLAALEYLKKWEGLPALLAHLATQGGEPAAE